MSVGAASEIWKRCAFLEGQKAIVTTHQDKTTRLIYDYYLQFDDSYSPDAIGIDKLRRISTRYGESMEFVGGGGVLFDTAGNSTGGRGGSVRYLHNSECSFWPNADVLRTGLMQMVPMEPGTIVIDESTANGVGGQFHHQWQMAMDPGSGSMYEGLFFAWWENPEYAYPVDNPHRYELNRLEHSLMERYSISLEQIEWRRRKIISDCGGDERKFQQEFPSDPEEAFVSSGRPFFDMGALAVMPTVREWATGDLEVDGPLKSLRFRPRTDGQGPVQILRHPIKAHRYVMGLDVSQGIDVALPGATPNPDYSTIVVVDRVDGMQVCTVRLRLAPAAFAELALRIHAYYNSAYMVPERNNYGIAVIQELRRLDLSYEHLYIHGRDPHDLRPPLLQELGFPTSMRTRTPLLSDLERAIGEQSILLTHPLTLQECRTFVYHADGKPAAQLGSGDHDDLVFAAALAVVGLQHAPGPAMDTPLRVFFQGDPDDLDNPNRHRSKTAYAFRS